MFDQIKQAMQMFSNPQSFFQSIAQNNPQVEKMMGMTRGKDENGIWEVARNMAREQGLNFDQLVQGVKRQYGL